MQYHDIVISHRKYKSLFKDLLSGTLDVWRYHGYVEAILVRYAYQFTVYLQLLIIFFKFLFFTVTRR